MRFAILFEDDPAKAEMRSRHMAEHLAFLEAHGGEILAAGPLADGTEPAGGLWIVEADNAARAEALVHADPFWPTGLRRSVRILAWTRVFTDGARLIGR